MELSSVGPTTHELVEHSVDRRTKTRENLADDGRFRLIFERSLDAIVVLNDAGRYLLANQAACDLLGYPLDNLLAMRVGDISSVGSPSAAAQYEAYVQTGRASGRSHFRRPDGQDRFVEYTATKLAPDEHVCIFRDVTERERAALRSQRLAAIVASAEEAIVGVSTAGLITDWNNGAEQLYGYATAEVIGQPLLILAAPERSDEACAILSQVLHGQNVRNLETVRVHKNGKRIEVSITSSTTRDAAGNVLGHSIISHDVSELRLIEREALELTVRERQRIGQDLHDHTGQELAGLSLMAGALCESLTKLGLDEAQLAGKIQNSLQGAIAQVQSICRGLIPIEIETGGLTAALQRLVNRVEETTGLHCELRCHKSTTVDDNVTANELYRIAQEALNNTVKHAQAKNVQIFLGAVRDFVILNIRDDGVGVKLPLSGSNGMGLRIMRYRAERIGAQFRIEAGWGGGSLVSCILVNRRSA